MKKYLLTIATAIIFIQSSFLSQTSNLQFPTFAELPGPENVLVVYRIDHPYSLAVTVAP